MAIRTGRKQVASTETRKRAVSIKKSNPGITHKDIATRLGVSTRQIQYWLEKARQKGEL